MVKVTVSKGDEKMLRDSIQALYLLADEPLEEIMRNQGRLLAIDASTWTRIYGKSAKTGKVQSAAIMRSISRTYKGPNKVAGAVAKKAGRKAQERFVKYIRANNTAKAQEMIDDMGIRIPDSPWGNRQIKIIRWDNGTLHKNRRKRKNFDAPTDNYVVTNYKKVTAYAKSEAQKAGELKSGWANAAKMLAGKEANPTKGIPGYAKKKRHKTKGFGSTGGAIGRKFVKVTNLSNYANSGNTDEVKAMSQRISNLKKLTSTIFKRRQRSIVKTQRARTRNFSKLKSAIKLTIK